MKHPQYRLVVSQCHREAKDRVAILKHHIRSRPEEIARHCLVTHRGIMEDIATVSESIALADRHFPRMRGTVWGRSIEVEIPVFEIATFQKYQLIAALTEAVHFLTGDKWTFSFVRREGQPISQETLPFEQIKYRFVTPYSDGLDSYAQTKLLETEVGKEAVLKIRCSRMGEDSEELRRQVLRVPRRLGPMPKPEKTYRSRPFVFFSFAGIGAFVSNAEAVIIGESGQGALGPAMIRYAGEWPFRSTHPGFVARMRRYLSLAFEKDDIEFKMPQLWRTKGQVLRLLADRGLLGRWEGTQSCSVRPNDRHGTAACGICGGCMLRALAISAANVTTGASNSAFEIDATDAVAVDGSHMSPSERHMVVRSLGTIVEFARLAESPQGRSLIEAESLLFERPDAPTVASRLQDLVLRHRNEWQLLASNLPRNGWARAIAEQL